MLKRFNTLWAQVIKTFSKCLLTLICLGVIIDFVIRGENMEKEIRKSTWQAIEKFNLKNEELALLSEVFDFASRNGLGDSFENSIREINSDSNLFSKVMQKDAMRRKYGENFEFAKLMVTKINPNTILAFKLSMMLPKRELKDTNPELCVKILKRREFFVNFFKNDCDLSPSAFPNVKVSKICEMGFMKKDEIKQIKEKRNKEVNKNISKNDYNRGTYTFEKY